jgi:hypothetical protein
LTHVCVLVPQLPHETWFVVPGAHEPVHAPPMHVSFMQSTAVPHWPHASHVCTPLLVALHCLAPGVHTGALGQEHGPQPQDGVHVCVPYVLHACVAFAAHAPCPPHVPSCHTPLALHVCVLVPQFPHATGFLSPGLHMPVHPPPLQTYEHEVPLLSQVPPSLHFCGCMLLHCPAPGLHDPAHVPPLHTFVHGDPTFCQLPVESHFCG